jgi:hypothetical protein
MAATASTASDLKWIFGRNTIAFDVETTGCVFGGPNRLRHTIGVAWCSLTKCMYSFREEELGSLALMLDGSDCIIAHNSSFDIGVLDLYFSDKARVAAWRAKVIDPFEVIRRKEGTWPGLGAICEVNNRPTKTGTGLEAITMWKDGRVKELAAYCAVDVLIMVKLLEIGESDDWFWYCQKRYDLSTTVQRHLRAGRVNKRTMQIVMGEEGSFPPGFEGACPCIKKAKEQLAEREVAAAAMAAIAV